MGTKPLFQLLDHCCSVCGGRLLLGDDPQSKRGGVQVRCAECTAIGVMPASTRAPYEALCFCGVKFANGSNAGLRCRRADRPSPERPQELVVRQEASDAVRSPSRGSRPVRLPGDGD